MFVGVLLTRAIPLHPEWYLVCLCPLLPPDSQASPSTTGWPPLFFITRLIRVHFRYGSRNHTPQNLMHVVTSAHPMAALGLNGQLAAWLFHPLEPPTLA